MVTRSIKAIATGLSIISTLHTTAAQFSYVAQGCWSTNIGNVVYHNASVMYNTGAECQTLCNQHSGATVMALNYRDCWCGSLLPSLSSKASTAQCNQYCPGYNQDMCGGQNGQFYTVYLTGSQLTGVGHVGSSQNSMGGSQSSLPPSGSATQAHGASGAAPTVVQSVITIGSTIVRTIGGSATSTPTQGSASSSGGSKAGIAAGVVVGLVAIAAIIGGVFVYLRHRRRKSIEKEHRRQSSINAFANTRNKTPHMSILPTNDSRLDPVIAARRQSDGSIADNQDFSRRVLKVTNPDDRW